MSKFTLFIMSFYTSLCTTGIYAQEVVRQVMSINDIFSLADQNSKSLRPFATGINEASKGVKVAKNARLPEIDVAQEAAAAIGFSIYRTEFHDRPGFF